MTRYIVFLSLCLLLCSTHLQAQFAIGAKAGANTSFIFVDNINIRQSEPTLNGDLVQGIVFGAVGRFIPKDKNSGILMEFNYSQKGWKDNILTGGSYTATLNYVEVPIMAHIRIGRKRTRIGINMGPSFTYLISYEEAVSGGAALSETAFRITDNNSIRPGYGLALGLSATRETSLGDFQLDFRYNLGLSNVLERVDDTIPDFSQLQDIAISLSYLLPFGKKKIRKADTFGPVSAPLVRLEIRKGFRS